MRCMAIRPDAVSDKYVKYLEISKLNDLSNIFARVIVLNVPRDSSKRDWIPPG